MRKQAPYPFILIGILLVSFGLATIASTQSASTVSSASGALSTNGAAPVVSACGTTPTIRGNNYGGVITTGSGPISACTITFTPAFGTVPSCVASNTSTGAGIAAATTTTTLVMTGSGVDMTSDIVNYICVQVP